MDGIFQTARFYMHGRTSALWPLMGWQDGHCVAADQVAGI